MAKIRIVQKTVVVGNTRVVVMGATEQEAADLVAAEIERGLKRGLTVRLADGSVRWVRDEVVIDTTKSGSAIYTWDRTGNRVLFQRVLYVRDMTGAVSGQVLRKLYKSYDEV